MTQGAASSVESSARSLREFLAGRDIQCPKCLYLLRDCHGEICPECGEPIDGAHIQSLIDAEKKELRGFGQMLLLVAVPPLVLAAALIVLIVRDLPRFDFGPLFVVALLLLLSFYPMRLGWRMSRRLPPEALPPTWSRRAAAMSIYLLVGIGLVDIVVVGLAALMIIEMWRGP